MFTLVAAQSMWVDCCQDGGPLPLLWLVLAVISKFSYTNVHVTNARSYRQV